MLSKYQEDSISAGATNILLTLKSVSLDGIYNYYSNIGEKHIDEAIQVCCPYEKGKTFNIKCNHKDIKLKILDIQIRKLHDIPIQDRGECMMSANAASEWHYNDSYGLGMNFVSWLEKQGIHYDSNPYVFLIKFKEIK